MPNGSLKDPFLLLLLVLGLNVSALLGLTGDLGGSTVHDEVGVDTDSKPRPGLPNSPSSSGGFRSVSFLQKGLCRRDICAQHYIGGIMELLKKMFRLCCVLLLPPAQEFVFRL